jgi:cytidyltransferase-like protein
MYQILFCLIFGSLFPGLAFSIDFDQVKFQPGQRVGIFRGSFDPIHLGHDEAIRESITSGKLDYVVVVPDRKVNPFKPERINWQLRQRMIDSLYSESDQVVTTQLDPEQVVHEIREISSDLKIVGIIGSDQAIRHLQAATQPKMDVDEWVVITRNQDRQNQILNQLNVPGAKFSGKFVLLVDPIRFKLQDSSSTQVRRFLREHPEFYTGPSDRAVPMLPLDSRVAELIRSEHLYQSETKSISADPLHSKIMSTISSWLNENESESCLIKNAKDEGKNSFSGDQVFMIRNDQGHLKYVAKAFVVKPIESRFEAESFGFEFLKRLNLGLSTIPDVLYFHQEEDFSLLMMEPAKGETFRSILEKVASSRNDSVLKFQLVTRAKSAAFRIGMALAELNSHVNTPIVQMNEDEFHRYDQYFRVSLAVLKANQEHFEMFNLRNLKNLEDQYTRYYQAFFSNPGSFAYAHGDAAPGNILFDSQTDRVTLIDFLTLKRSIGKANEPIGFPAYEYHQFLSSIHWVNDLERLGLSNDEMSLLEESFSQGYHSIKKVPFTREADSFFSFLWQLKGIATQLKRFSLLSEELIDLNSPEDKNFEKIKEVENERNRFFRLISENYEVLLQII